MFRRHPTSFARAVDSFRRRIRLPLLLLLVAVPSHATFSILARDPATGQIGGAVQSHWFQVHDVIWVEPGVGAVATQSLADFSYGPAGLELLRLGRTAEKALHGLRVADTSPELRQVAILDADGEIAVHTGEKCIAHAGHLQGEHWSVQANLMEHDTVPRAMADAFLASGGDLADRLMAALDAAEAQGGDLRGRQSASLVVVGSENTGRSWSDRVFDLRVDDLAKPLQELRRLLTIARAYRAMNDADLAMEAGDFAGAEKHYAAATTLPGNPEPLFWHAIALANNGRVEEAVKLLPKVYAVEPRFRLLPARLVPSGFLPDDAALVDRLTKARR
jgi:uncharacterized Ntn-hydrolase superfamily protein